jgi:cellulose synthase/poly-beta-1,6-N-acetylglucosamine synthase-like glycosyltransferase
VILIPGFKEDKVILEVAKGALNQDYPRELYEVIVIADSFLSETITQLKRLSIKVIEVSFDNSTKAKSINAALAQVEDVFDIALILDADNLMEEGFISKINDAFSKGFLCVQGHRLAKNKDTSIAILDAISEEVNNKLFRKGHRILGLSSALIGSGMAFDYHLYKEKMKTINAIGGFDKELELILLKCGNKIEYVEDALVYDEKVSTAKTLSKQRKRWISAQYIYFKRSIGSSFHELLFSGNIDYFIKSLQFALLPRILMVGFLFAILIFSIFLNEPIYTKIWAVLFMMSLLAIIFAIPKKFYNKSTLKALLYIPHGFFIILLTLFQLKGANKKFIHTEHGL